MHGDFRHCEIRTPGGDDLMRLYEFLSEVFPPDRAVFAEMVRTSARFYTWTPHTLYDGGAIVANVSLMPMRIWLGGRSTQVVGIASVATDPARRRQGAAGYLLRHALGLVEPLGTPCVLLTGNPDVYRGAGFVPVAQEYRAVRRRNLEFSTDRFDTTLLDSLDDDHMARLARIYAGEYPNYDGKVDRDADYWRLYRMLFNLAPKSQIALCERGGSALGYARFEQEEDRLTVCELCAAPSAGDVCEFLPALAARALAARARAARAGTELVSFALPADHFVWAVLRRRGVTIAPEPPGIARESFLVRPAATQPHAALSRLQWSLADKF